MTHKTAFAMLRRKLNFLSAFVREKTGAHRRLTDDVPEGVKRARHLALTETYRTGLGSRLAEYIGRQLTVLVTGTSKRSQDDLQGRQYFFKF